MLWLIYALTAAVLWGIGQVVVKKGFGHLSPTITYAADTVFKVGIFVPFALLAGSQKLEGSATLLLIAFLSTLLGSVYYYSVSRGQIALTGTIVATSPAVVVILATLFLGETTTIEQKMIIAAIILGTLLVAFPKKVERKALIHPESWVFWGILGALMIGSSDTVSKFGIDFGGIYTFVLYSALTQIPIALTYLAVDRKGRSIPKTQRRKALPTIVGAGMMVTAYLFYLLAFGVGKASLVAPVSATYQAITVILGVIFLKETITKLQAAGATLAILGIIVLSAL